MVLLKVLYLRQGNFAVSDKAKLTVITDLADVLNGDGRGRKSIVIQAEPELSINSTHYMLMTAMLVTMQDMASRSILSNNVVMQNDSIHYFEGLMISYDQLMQNTMLAIEEVKKAMLPMPNNDNRRN
jgi:hypothetical protein